MIGPIEKRPFFYWLLFRISDEKDADWFAGRIMLTGGQFLVDASRA
jgi:hypothetical protein